MSIEFHCPSCNKKLFSYEARVRKYGKLTKECKKCGATYIDPRCHELAIDGIPQDEFGVVQYILAIVIGILIAWRGIHMFGMHQLGVANEIQWFLPTVFILIGIAAVIGGIYEIIAIKTGIKKKKFDKMYEESKARMRDSSYIYTLEKLGYNIPEEYRMF